MSLGALSGHFGFGRHLIYLAPSNVVQAAKWDWIVQIPWVFLTTCTRLSISVFLYRLFATKESSRRVLYVIIALTVTSNVALIVTVLSQCSPLQKNWDRAIPGHCWNPTKTIDVSLFQGGESTFKELRGELKMSAASALCDFSLAFLPIVFLWNVQIKGHIKIGICCLMGLGFL